MLRKINLFEKVPFERGAFIFWKIFDFPLDKSPEMYYNISWCNTQYYKEVCNMTISIRLSESDSALIRKYAEMNKITISDLVRQTLLERIEEEYDIAEYEEAMKEYLDNPKTYSLDEVEKELGLV